jgi:hypothetical protein
MVVLLAVVESEDNLEGINAVCEANWSGPRLLAGMFGNGRVSVKSAKDISGDVKVSTPQIDI